MTEHITHTTCPDCGAVIISEMQHNRHSNGHWNEEVKFKCGSVFRFSPNFMSVTKYKPCSETDEAKEIKTKRLLAREKTIKYIRGLDVDEAFKAKMIERFDYLQVDDLY